MTKYLVRELINFSSNYSFITIWKIDKFRYIYFRRCL